MHASGSGSGPIMVYQIRLKGILSDQWKEWFDEMAICQDAEGNTILTGPVVDQSALHGLLDKVSDLGLPLLSILSIDGTIDKGNDEI